MSETTLFLVFATFTLLSALMVIRSKNPVYSVLFLILVFCNAAGLLVLLDLDFFAVVFFGRLRRGGRCSFPLRSYDVRYYNQ